MLKLFEKVSESELDFCDRCGSVCTVGCRADPILRRSLEKAMIERGRLL